MIKRLLKKSWFLKAIAIAIVCETVIGIGQIRIYFWIIDYGPNIPDDFNPPDVFISWWTLRRPFVFLVLWYSGTLVLWSMLFVLFALRLKGKKTNLPIAGVWAAMLSCYATSLYEISGSVQAYLYQPPIHKPFIGRLNGFNEWDAIRFAMIIVLLLYWVYSTRRNATKLSHA